MNKELSDLMVAYVRLKEDYVNFRAAIEGTVKGRRKVDARFVAAMNEKLDAGRAAGKTDYDSNWAASDMRASDLLECLRREVSELTDAYESRDYDAVRNEAADVANFAMFIVDLLGAWREK